MKANAKNIQQKRAPANAKRGHETGRDLSGLEHLDADNPEVAMQYRKILFVMALVVTVFSLSSCVSQKQHRASTASCQILADELCPDSQWLIDQSQPAYNCAIASSPQATGAQNRLEPAAAGTNEVYLGFLEFDERGELWNRDHATSVIEHVRTLADNGPVSIVVYAHGWNHNADADDNDVSNFRELLGELVKAEAAFACQMGKAPERTVVGIYLGWRGKSAQRPLNYLTFWTRKTAAHRMGTDGVFEVVKRLSDIRNSSSDMKNRLALIGHSFGGAMMFTATTHALTASLEDMSNGKNERFADIVVLLNAAIEAQRFSNLFNRSYDLEDRLSNQMPLFLSITSSGDLPTKMAFPIGRKLSTVFESYRSAAQHPETTIGDFDQRAADRTAIGHFVPFTTHVLATCSMEDAIAALEECPDREGPSELQDADYIKAFDQTAAAWHSIRPSAGWSIRFPTAVLYHISGPPQGVMLNVTANNSLIVGHSGIWGSDIMLFIRDFVAMNYVAEEDRPGE